MSPPDARPDTRPGDGPDERPAYLTGRPLGLRGAHAAAARALREDGFCVLDLRDADTLARCDEAVRQLAPFHAAGANRVQDAWRRCPAVRALASDARVRSFLDGVYGRGSFPFQTLSFERGSRQGLHSDATHFYSDPPGYVAGVWLALEDVDAAAGPLTYVPGSHRWPTLTPRAMGVAAAAPGPADYARAVGPAIRALMAEHDARAVPALLAKGQAAVWSADLIHGGAPVTDPARTRRSLVTHHFFEGCLHTTPMTSGARRTLRVPQDVATGRLRWPRGVGLALPPKTIADAARRRLGRRVHRFER